MYKDNHFYLRRLAELTRCFLKCRYLKDGGQNTVKEIAFWMPLLSPALSVHLFKMSF